MMKGVNRQVLEISEPGCDCFERVLFFVKPEFSGMGEARLREKAKMAMPGSAKPPAMRRRKDGGGWRAFLYALLGAGITSLLWGAASLFF